MESGEFLTVQGCTIMMNTVSNISQNLDTMSNLPDNSQSSRTNSEKFSQKLDKVLQKYKKNDDAPIRTQREVALKTSAEKVSADSAEESTAYSEGSQVSVATDKSKSAETDATESALLGKLSASAKSKLKGKTDSEQSDADADLTALGGTTAELSALAETSLLTFGSALKASAEGTESKESESTSQLLNKIVKLFEQSDSAKSAESSKASSDTVAKAKATAESEQVTAGTTGIKLKDLERILKESGYNPIFTSETKGEKTTGDVGRGRQLPNVVFKTAKSALAADAGESTTMAGTAKSAVSDASGKVAVAQTEESATIAATADKNSTPAKTASLMADSSSNESENINTLKVNIQKSENNNPKFSAENGENSQTSSGEKKDTNKNVRADNALQGLNLQTKTEVATEKTQQIQELKNVEVKEFNTVTMNLIKNVGSNSVDTVQMTLNPNSLGTLIVEVAVEGDVAKVSIKADTQDAVKVIEEQMPLLKEKLMAQGLKLEQADISQYTRDDSSGQSFAHDKNRRDENETRRAFIRTAGRYSESLQDGLDTN
jgi:flagellar hook-length control protein FliK